MLFPLKNHIKPFLSNNFGVYGTKVFVLFSLFILLFTACRDIYEPELDVQDRYMVVEGLITDEEGPHRVRLSKTNIFGETSHPEPVVDATVQITSSAHDTILLAEKEPGAYFTPDAFKGLHGETYKLHIEKANGTRYRSEPQELRAPVEKDTIFGEYDSQLFFRESQVSGDLIQDEVDGVNMFMDVSRDDEQTPLFRFSTSMLLQYIVQVSTMPPEYDFCWRKRPITDYLDKDIGTATGSSVSNRNRFAFFPLNTPAMRYLGFPISDDDTSISYIHPRILINSIYTLNDDAYAFHQARNQQLSDDGSLFDPIAPQLPGNVFNTEDGEDEVIGFFEASSVIRVTINVRPFADGRIEVDYHDCMHEVSAHGCMFMDQPDWWI
ncbi:MAG: DUF4249 domain-containing protein [Bacteroidota bacterium]